MNKSESIKNIAVALVKFNSEVTKIAKDANNPFFKNTYATLDQIIDQVRPLLSKHGLTIMQIPSGDGQNVTVKTLLLHESGEWLESDELTMRPVKNDPQAIGSCITYARRYSIASFLSLNTGEDDDGNKATHETPPEQRKGTTERRNNNGNSKGAGTSQSKVKVIFEALDKIDGLGKEKTKVLGELDKLFNLQGKKIKDLNNQQQTAVLNQLNAWIEKIENK